MYEVLEKDGNRGRLGDVFGFMFKYPFFVLIEFIKNIVK